EEMVEALDTGSDLFSVAAAQGQIPQASGTFTRSGARSPLDADVTQAAFQGGEGFAGYVPTQDGTIVVFEVTDVIPASADTPSQAAQALSASFADLLYSSFIDGLRQDASIRLNQDAFNRVVGIE